MYSCLNYLTYQYQGNKQFINFLYIPLYSLDSLRILNPPYLPLTFSFVPVLR